MPNKRKAILMIIPVILMIIATHYIYHKGLENYNDYRYKSAKNVKALFKPIYDHVACSFNDCSGFLAIQNDNHNIKVSIMDQKANIINTFTNETPDNELNLLAYYNDFYIIKERAANCQKYCDSYHVYQGKNLKLSLKNITHYSNNLIVNKTDSAYELYDRKLKKIKDLSLDAQIISDDDSLFISAKEGIINTKGKLLANYSYIESIKEEDKIKVLIIKKDDKYQALYPNGDLSKSFDSYFVDKYNHHLIVHKDGDYYYLKNNNFNSKEIKADYYNRLGIKTSFMKEESLKDSIYSSNQEAHIVIKDNKIYIYHHKSEEYTLINEHLDNLIIKKLDNNINKNVLLLLSFKDNKASIVYDFTEDKEIFKNPKKNEIVEDIIFQGDYVSLAAFSNTSRDIYRYYLYKDNKLIEKSIYGLIGLYNAKIDYGTRNDYTKYFEPRKGFILNNDRSNIFMVSSQDKPIEVINNKDAVIILNDELKYTKIDKKLVNINNIGINFEPLNSYYNFFDNALYTIQLKKHEKQTNRDGNVLYPYRNAFFINNFKEKEAKIVSKKETNVIYKSSGEILDVYKKANGKILVYFKTLNNKKTILEIS